MCERRIFMRRTEYCGEFCPREKESIQFVLQNDKVCCEAGLEANNDIKGRGADNMKLTQNN